MYCNIEDMVGKTFKEVVGKEQGEELVFIEDTGKKYIFFHDQDCCETVYIESIVGDLGDLVGAPLLKAEESTSDLPQDGQDIPGYDYSFTWTFYKFATKNGYVDVRWFGSSNGYYSEEVSLKVE